MGQAEAHTCPRRAEGPLAAEIGSDTYLERGGLIGQEAAGRSCSYCGSLHPDRFLELLREGWYLGPTDKNYKAYLGKPLTDEEIARCREQWLEQMKGVVAASDLGSGWEEQRLLIQGGGQQAKFYYQHLSSDQRNEFIALHNSGEMKIGYPGRLYVMPSFCRSTPPS